MRLEAQRIELDAGSFHLGPLDLVVGDGEYLAVLGPSGAGKTLTLECIAGLRPPARGRILIDSRDITAAPPESRAIGFLYQDSLLFPHLKVRDNLAYGAHRMPRARRDAAVARLAAMLHLEPLLDRMPRGLSGGERQRAALGRALAASPRLLLLDEPMAALDPNSRLALRKTLHDLHRALGTTTIHVTHNFAEAMALGDRVAILIEGRVLQSGPPAEVFTRPASPAVARFLRSARLSDSEGMIAPEAGAPTILARELTFRIVEAAGGAPVAQLKAEGARLCPPETADAPSDTLDAPRPDTSSDETLTGRVISVESDGNGALKVAVNVGMELLALLDIGEPPSSALAPGAAVRVRLPAASRR